MITSFPAVNEILAPDELYIRFKQSLPPTKKHQYVTGPINSGGARRKYSFENASPEQLQVMIATIIKENVQFATIVLNSLLKQRQLESGSLVTTPYKLGPRRQLVSRQDEVTPWHETEYLLFWSMVIAGVSIEYAPFFYSNALAAMRNNPAVIDGLANSRKARIPHFIKMEAAVKEEINNAPAGSIDPIESLITFPDAHYSLGSTFEQRLAQYLNVPSKQVLFNIGHPFFHTSLIAQDGVFQYLRQVNDGLKLANNDKSLFTLGLVSSDEVSEYTV